MLGHELQRLEQGSCGCSVDESLSVAVYEVADA
jgi:hypothetical protein